jgi:sensor histidine kinase YesM
MTDIELQGQKSFIGTNVSGISWIQEITFTHKPVFSNGYNALDGRYRVAVSYPIINRETGEYHGLVGFSVPTVQLFEHYGNIFDIKSQYLAVLDRDSSADPSSKIICRDSVFWKLYSASYWSQQYPKWPYSNSHGRQTKFCSL